MKKVSALILTVMLLSSAVFSGGCGSNNFIGEPDYSDSIKKFHIGAWIAPPPSIMVPQEDEYGQVIKDENGDPVYVQSEDFMTLEHYQNIADSGITTIYALYEPHTWTDDTIIKALDLAEQVGISYYVRDNNIWSLADLTDEEIESCTDFDHYKDKKAFAGHLVVDEPGANMFDSLAALKPKYEKMFPGKNFYINLFPTYANLSYLNTDYYSYIDQYIEKINPAVLSYDSYALVQNAYGKASLQEDYLNNLVIIAAKTQKANIPFWTFIQSIGFGMSNRSPENTGDISFQVYTNLAYGASGFQHFCYWTPLGADRGNVFEPGMITKDGEKTPIYGYVQIVNNEVQKFSNVMLSFKWNSTLTYLGSNNTKNIAFNMLNEALETKLGKVLPKSHPRISLVKSQEDVIIGTFKDEKGYDGFMAVNYSDPSEKKSTEFSVTFKDAKKAVVYIKGEKTVVNLDKGKYAAVLEPGEGRFIIPFN